VIELKTDIVDVDALVGGVDRKTRLAARIASDHGWEPATVSCWVIVVHDKTNQRHIDTHRTMLRAAIPTDGRAMHAWVRRPAAPVRAVSMWTTIDPTGATPSRSHRVRSLVRQPVGHPG
jgi:hypothetical protein